MERRQLSFDNEAYGMLQGLMLSVGTGKGDCLLSTDRRHRPVDEARHTGAQSRSRRRRISADDLLQQTFERMVARGRAMDWLCA